MDKNKLTLLNEWLHNISKLLLYIFFFSLILSNTIAQGTAGVLSLILIVRLIITKGRAYIFTPLDIPFGLFIFLRFVSTFLNYEPFTALEITGRRLLLYSIYFVITNTVSVNDIYKESIKYAGLIIVSCIIGSGHAFYEAIFLDVDRPGSFAGGYSRLAEFSAISLILTMFLQKNKSVFSRSLLFWCAFVIIISILIITQSRAAWISSGVVILFYSIRDDRRVLYAFTIIFISALLFSPAIRSRALTLLNPTKHTSGRDIIWREAIENFQEKPIFGHGVKSMKLLASQDIKSVNTWHSDYLQILLESGLLGLIAYLYLSFMLFKNAYRLLQDKNIEGKDMISGITFSLVCMYIISFFGGHIVEPVLSILFFSFIAMISKYSERMNRLNAC